MKWEDYIKDQQDLCLKNEIEWTPLDKDSVIGVADHLMTDLTPINGLRHGPENGTTGWYIWSGQEFSKEKDFFKPYCAKHLIDLKPEIIKYLGLPPGYRFLIDNEGYEDIWEDRALLD